MAAMNNRRGQKNILLLSTADWDNPFWTNKQRMAVLFAEHDYNVVYVDSLGLRQPSLHPRDIKRIFKRLLKAVPIPRNVAKNIWRISPFLLPFHSIPFVRRINRYILLLTIKWNLFLLGIRRPLIITYTPIVSDICRSLPHEGIVYHCVDDLGASPGIDVNVIRQEEARLAQIADICFVTSRHLQKMLAPIFSRVIYDPNVCDLGLFQSAHDRLDEPMELVGIPRPRLIFSGALSQYKVDFSLMQRVAELLPDVQWVLIGPVGEGQPDTEKPPRMPNVHILGPRSYEHLPAFLAHCDIAVLPAARNAYTTSMFPMKFFEYLASGLPVVATRLPALEEFERLYFPADTAEEFAEHIRNVLEGERRDANLIDAACLYHTWEARFKRMETAVQSVLAKE